MGVFDLHPFTLLVVVTVTLILKQCVKGIGQSNIDGFVWGIYCKLAPFLGHSKLSIISEKRADIHQVNIQRKAVSAQDEYARWTKLNRQFDKLTAEVENLNGQLAQERALVVKLLGYIITLFTVLPIWFFRLWFRKSVLFHFPPGVLPYPVERLFAAPFVILGGVGLTVWMFSVNSVISSIVFMVKFPFEEKVDKPQKRVEVVETETTGTNKVK